jgi:hypothetical protein
MKKSILLSFLCCILGSFVYTQDWVTFTKTTPEQPNIKIIGSNNQQVKFSVEVCGMYKTDITKEGEPFQRIEVPGAGKTTETGSPELPYIRQLIAIPECEDVVLTVDITGQINFSNYNIYPTPGYEEVQNPDGTVYLQEVFTKDEAVYNYNEYMTGMNAEIVSTGYLRDQKYAEVFLYPIQFNPVLKHINVFTHYQITLDFVNPTTPVNVNTGIFNNVATNTMINYVSSGITASINDNVQGNGNVQWIELTDPAQADNIVADYLIICAENFFEPSNPDSEVLRIANHRATYNGFDVAIISAHNILLLPFEFEELQYEKEQKIRTCIRRIYEGANAQHTYDGMLGYVLLIGDIELNPTPENPGMPSSYEHGISYPSDYYFSCKTKENEVYDTNGDLYIGRFCVDNNLGAGLTELHNIVEKTIYFESEYSFGDWRNNVAHANGNSYVPAYFPLYYEFIEDLLFEENLTIVNWYELNFQINQPVIDMLNEGAPVMMYEGHGYIETWQDNLSIDELENNLTNTGKFPYVTSRACQTGWFDYESDCLGEALTTYAEDKGFVGFLGAARDHFMAPNPPPITDPPTRLQERIPYSIWHDLSFITGEFILETKIGIEAPGTAFLFNYFGDPALNIMADGFEVTHDIELPEITTISTEITVKNGTTITIPRNGQLRFEADGKLIIDGTAVLIISDDAILSALNANQLVINGNITIGDDVTFTSTGLLWDVYLNNPSLQTMFNNTSFEKCRLHNYGQKLTISNCTFDDCYMIVSHRGEVTVNQSSELNNTWLYIENSDDSNDKATVTDCSFSSNGTLVAIDLWNYDNYDISNNTIDGYYNGIQISQSGYGQPRNQIIQDNTVSNCTQKGILAYGSIGDVYRNHIFNNNYGVWFGNQSDMRLKGYSGANANDQTQEIWDNTSYEVYASQYSFPTYFRYNVIIDEDNLGGSADPLVYYSSGSGGIPLNDVRYNCWGQNFIAAQDLYPSGYIWQPVWCPGIGGQKSLGLDEDMFETASNQFYEKNYAAAKVTFELLVEQYPGSRFAKTAMQQLFALEEFENNDYTILKHYYQNNNIILSDSVLTETAQYLASKCDIKLQNWQDAINYNESIILNPESLEDSIFAIIDLGYIYFVMENTGNKSTCTGNLIEYKPKSMEQFVENKNYLLSLIPGNQMSETMKESIVSLKDGELMQNVPNPFNGSTQIWYKLENESAVQLNIYNYTGQLISTINEGFKTKGNHHIGFNANGLKSGIYFYSISINGQTTDSKKMTILK